MARFGKLGWFLGLIFGAVFGVLFAPRKGKDLRARIKADRKRGKLGTAPLHADLKELGKELAEIAMDVYESEPVQGIVIKGRKKVKELSKDLIGDVVQFEKTTLKPVKEEAKKKVEFVKVGIEKGKRAFKTAKKEFKIVQKKAKAGAKISKRAFREIKRTIKES